MNGHRSLRKTNPEFYAVGELGRQRLLARGLVLVYVHVRPAVTQSSDAPARTITRQWPASRLEFMPE